MKAKECSSLFLEPSPAQSSLLFCVDSIYPSFVRVPARRRR